MSPTTETETATPACRVCHRDPAYPGAVYCGSACCARYEGGARKCDTCKGSGYWSNYPPKPDAVLDMMDCCGVCGGKGYLTHKEREEARHG